jgi:KaiC/GvpD/RAD55 family RecA-like ATPase
MIPTLADGSGNQLFLVLSSPENLKKNNIEIIRSIISQGNSVIVVTTNQPFEVLKKAYEKAGIEIGKIRFIDAITLYAVGKSHATSPECRFVTSPSNLTDLGIVITETLKSMKERKPCIIFDSISTMLIYIPSSNISKFIHFVTSKLRVLEAAGIFLAVEKGLDPVLLTQLTTYVDDVLDMDEAPQTS